MCDSVRLLFFFFFHGYRAVLSNANTSCASDRSWGNQIAGPNAVHCLFHWPEVVLNSVLTNTAPFYSPATPLATPHLICMYLALNRSPRLPSSHACSRRSVGRELKPASARASHPGNLLFSKLLTRSSLFSAETSPRARARCSSAAP